MDGVWNDIRLAARSLHRAPGFTIAAVTVLALGIGANATVFSALRAVVLAGPPWPDAERLVVADLTRQSDAEPVQPMSWSFPKYIALVDHPARPLDPVVGYANRAATLTDAGPPEMINLELVSPGYFDLVGRPPVLGRAFTGDELDPAGAPDVAILAAEFWRGRFGADPDILGRPITLNGRRLRVVGVAPDGFDGITGGARLWIPLGAAGSVFSPFMVEGSGAHWFHVLGRAPADATLDEVREQMAAVGDGIAVLYPSSNPNRVYSGSARALTEVSTNEGARTSVIFLSLAAGLVLLVACANLSGLMLARARRRAHDGAVRVALGASRWQLVRASLVESGLIAAAGGLAGVLVSIGGTRAMAGAWPSRFLGGEDGVLRVMDPTSLGVDPVVLGFAVGVTLATALLFGLAPAIRASRADVGDRIRGAAGATRRHARILGLDARAALVGGQIALALVLLIGAGLVGGSTLRLLEVDEGFRTDDLLTFSYSIPTTNSRIDDPIALHDEFLDALRRTDGVESATFGCAPLRGHCIITRVDAILGGPEIPEGEGLEIGVRMIDDGHFAALGIPVLRGRAFDTRDGTDALPTVIVNQLAAERLFPGEDPLGRSVQLGIGSNDKEEMAEIVGVVGDVLYGRPDAGVIPEAYYSYREFPENHGNVTIRTTGDPMALVPTVRATLESIDPTLALYRIETMDRIIATSIGDRGTTLALLTIFAVLAIVLAATGTWGIVSYSVADRRRELGLRMALGAGRASVVRTVVDEGLRTAVLGVVLGLGLGLATSRLLGTILWETEPTEPVVYAGGALLLFGVVILASWLPARNAARVDPVEALKAE